LPHTRVPGALLIRYEEALDIEARGGRESTQPRRAENGSENTLYEKRSNCLRSSGDLHQGLEFGLCTRALEAEHRIWIIQGARLS